VVDAPDDVLMAGLAAGDDDAARQFVRRFSSRAIGLAYQFVGDRAAAEDIAQEAMLRAWRHAATFDARRGSLTTWILAIVRNLSIDALRMRRPVPFDPATLPVARLAEPSAAADVVHESLDDASHVRAALALVPIEQRRALVLAYAGMSGVEIAAMERIPLGTAKTRVRTGLRRLREAYVNDTEVAGG
jgi:RNA polymerase sigma factor (sigma-70 family)